MFQDGFYQVKSVDRRSICRSDPFKTTQSNFEFETIGTVTSIEFEVVSNDN